MIVVNFSHPLTDDQKRKIEYFTNQRIDRLIEIMARFDFTKPIALQVNELFNQTRLTRTDLQYNVIAVNLPALSIGAGLMTELLIKKGCNINFIRLSPVAGSLPPTFEVAEVV